MPAIPHTGFPGTKAMRRAITLLSSRVMAHVRSIAILFGRWRNRFFPSRYTDPRHKLGHLGENLAAKFLKQQGYKILCRNYRARGGGEVDLVCQQRDVYVFVEVKTRRSLAFGRPYEAVDAAKQRLIGKGAHAWMRRLGGADVYYRFDIVEVIVEPGKPPVCEIIADAF